MRTGAATQYFETSRHFSQKNNGAVSLEKAP